MTESGWRRSTDPDAMLEYLQISGKATDRQLRLFACACVRRVEHQMADQRSRRVLGVVERFADGLASTLALTRARNAAEKAHKAAEEAQAAMDSNEVTLEVMDAVAAAFAAATVGHDDVANVAVVCARIVASTLFGQYPKAVPELREQAVLLRDIIGSPFRRTPHIKQAWLKWHDGTIPRLAEAIYQERAFDRLPILADALEEAACDDADLLDHLRGPGPHVRGCWAVDILSGRM